MARFTLGIDPEDEFSYRATNYGVPLVQLNIGDGSLFFDTVASLHRLADIAMEGARDLEALLAPTFGSLIDEDNTAAAMAYVMERRAQAEARQREEEARAAESVDLAAEKDWEVA